MGVHKLNEYLSYLYHYTEFNGKSLRFIRNHAENREWSIRGALISWTRRSRESDSFRETREFDSLIQSKQR